MAEQGWADFIRYNQNRRSAVRKSFTLTTERISKIKSYNLARRIRYPEYADAFDYVDKLYPAANVKQATIYYCPKYFLREIGYSGIGGFYDSISKVVVVTDFVGEGMDNEFEVNGEFTIDEVLCHELIHYCANYKLPMANRNVEEEIAYGKSIGYLRSRGRSDEFIINKNMLPYLMSTVDKAEIYRKVLVRHFDESMLAAASFQALEKLLSELSREIFRESKEAAIKTGEKMLTIYGGGEIKERVSTRRNLIIEDDIDV